MGKFNTNFDFGRNLLIVRKKKLLTQEGLGALVGVSGVQIGRYEKNQDEPSNAMIRKLSDALEVSEIALRGLDAGVAQPELPSVGRKPSSDTLIPFYDAVAVGGTGILADQSAVNAPNDMIDPGTFLRRATGSLRIYGHSMFPKYPAGCIVAFREADLELIIWGEDYVIELEDRRIIKRVERGKEGYILAVSYNKSEEYVYAPIDIPVTKVKRLYMVLGKIELEASI